MGYNTENPQYSEQARQEIAREFPPVWASGNYADGYRQAVLDAAAAVNALACPHTLNAQACAWWETANRSAHVAVLALLAAALEEGE